MASTEEGKFRLEDGKELYTKSWRPPGPPVAVVVFLHGFSDHCNRYEPLFRPLAAAGVAVHGFDQRGWGRSVAGKAERGRTGPRAQYLADIAAVVRAHLADGPPLFLMGHSMGGQGVLLFAARGPPDVRDRVAGYVALAPWIQLHARAQPGALKLRLGRLAVGLAPHFQLFNKLDPRFQAHDEAVCADWDADPLCHDYGTLETLDGCLGAADDLHAGRAAVADGPGVRVFLGHGTEDMCTSHEATKAFAERLAVKDKTLKLYEGSYHCIHQEPGIQDQLVADVLEWIKAGLSKAEAGQAAGGASKL